MNDFFYKDSKMKKYYINTNAQSSGEHEIHREDCPCMFFIKGPIYLGEYTSCTDALRAAQRIYSNVDGCFYCCRECHCR